MSGLVLGGTSRSFNYGTRNDERFRVMNSRKIQQSDRSLVGYAQIQHSTTQPLVSGVRTQILNDGQGADTFSSENLWNPINNRINLQDARVGDIIMVDAILSAALIGSVLQFSVQLDYSSALDGSLVTSQPVSRILIVTFSTGPFSIHYSFKFVVTQAMKDNGIAIMATPFGNNVLTGTQFIIERYTVPT